MLRHIPDAINFRTIEDFRIELIEKVRFNSDWLRQCRRAGLYEQGRATYEMGGLNLANLTDEQQIEAEDDYRIRVRRGSDQEAKPRKRQRKMKPGDEQEEHS